jgi:hypothetical protein
MPIRSGPNSGRSALSNILERLGFVVTTPCDRRRRGAWATDFRGNAGERFFWRGIFSARCPRVPLEKWKSALRCGAGWRNFQSGRSRRGGPDPSPYPGEGRRFEMEHAQQDFQGDRRGHDGAIGCGIRFGDRWAGRGAASVTAGGGGLRLPAPHGLPSRRVRGLPFGATTTPAAGSADLFHLRRLARQPAGQRLPLRRSQSLWDGQGSLRMAFKPSG